MNNLIDVIKNRRSVRKYTDKVIAPALLEQVVEAATYAPSGMNNQFWHFCVLLSPTALEELRITVRDFFRTLEMKEGMPPFFAVCKKNAAADNFSFFYNAPALILVSNRKGYPNAAADSAAAIQNGLLAATALGLGSCWINTLTWIFDEPDIRQAISRLGVPDDHQICGAFILGYADETPVAAPRKENLVTWVK